MMFRPERAEPTVDVARVVQDDDFGAGLVLDAGEDLLPILGFDIWNPVAGGDWKDIEMAERSRDFVADDRREPAAHAELLCGIVKIDLPVVIGGDRQLDAFTGQSDDALVESRIAVTGIGQRVDVRVATDIAGRRHFAADRQRLAHDVAGLNRDTHRSGAVLEAATGIDLVVAGRDAELRPAVAGVKDAGPDG